MYLDTAQALGGGAASVPPTANGKVYSYTRFSTPEQAAGDSSRRQDEAACRWAARRRLQLDDTLRIKDEGVSAFRGSNAVDGGLAQFLQACRRGLIEPGSFLLVESLDRISRMTPRKAQRLLDDIVDAGVTIVTLNDDQEYTAERLDTDPTALLIALMVSWRAHEESKTKGRRVAAAWAEKRRKVTAGEVERLTTRGPSWLAPEGSGWQIIHEKAATVQRIFELTLRGHGEHSIARLFNRESVPMLGRGVRWHRSTVAKVLRNSAVLGILTPGRIEFEGTRRVRKMEAPVANAFPAVISAADWLAVRAIKDGCLGAPRGRHAIAGAAHLLAGLARCPTCGSAMARVNKGDPAKGGKPKLVCAKAKVGAGCGYVSIPVDQTDAAIQRDWQALLAGVPVGSGAAFLDDEAERIEASLMGTLDLLSDMVDALEKAPSRAAAARVAKLEAGLRLLQSEAAEVDEQRRMADKGLIRSRVGDCWSIFEKAAETGAAVSIPEVNSAFKVLFNSVVVDHASGLLLFQWRQGGQSELRFDWRG